jgi:hypothetical protein
MIYNKYTIDEHRLQLEDVQRKDRQNWASVQRMCQRKTQECLAKMRNSQEAHQECTLGTEMYLQFSGDYINIFASQVLDLRNRIVFAAKVSFFFRLWKLWFTHGNHAIENNSVRFTTISTQKVWTIFLMVLEIWKSQSKKRNSSLACLIIVDKIKNKLNVQGKIFLL